MESLESLHESSMGRGMCLDTGAQSIGGNLFMQLSPHGAELLG